MSRARLTIGIVTINDNGNYGNRLQNYALQEVLRGLGWEAETIRNAPQPWPRTLLIPRMLHEVRDDPRALMRRGAERLGTGQSSSPTGTAPFLLQRREAIARFTDTFIRTSDESFVDMPAEYWSERYRKVVTGSDQVWNPTYRRAQGFDFLDFAAPENRLAYAASFGVTAVPRFLRTRYADWLAQIPHLSVREQAAAAIVRGLTGRDVPVVADPTMLVDRSVWDGLIDGEPRTDTPYTARFMLGEPSSVQQAWLAQAAREIADDVVDLNDLTRREHSDIGPAGFVATIARASAVVTDSFHASVFALLYHRPLILRSRFRHDSRISSLLSAHGIIAETAADGIVVLGDVDWDAADAARDRHRADSSRFLRAALGTGTQAHP